MSTICCTTPGLKAQEDEEEEKEKEDDC